MITVNITMGDLIRFNAVEFARPRRLLAYLAAIALMIGAFLIAKHGWPQSSRNWFALAAGMLGGGIGGMLLMLLYGTLTIFFMASRIPGLLGRHDYEFTENGLIEHTSVNETLIKWGGARALHKNDVRLLIELGPGMAHIIPRRSFQSSIEFDAFAQRAERLRDPGSTEQMVCTRGG